MINDPIIRLDLHGMRQDEALKAIDRTLAAVGPAVYRVELIHGFHRGTSLQSMILDRCRYDGRVRRIIPGENRGITVLVLKEFY